MTQEFDLTAGFSQWVSPAGQKERLGHFFSIPFLLWHHVSGSRYIPLWLTALPRPPAWLQLTLGPFSL